MRDLYGWPAAVKRLREWCEAGGIWVELGRWPLWLIIAAPNPATGSGEWQRYSIGKAGIENLLGERCWLSRPPDNPPEPQPLRVTERGRAVFSPETIRALERQSAVVSHVPGDINGALPLCENDDGAYIMVHPMGYGAVVRLGGVPVEPVPAALAEAVEAMLDGKLELGGPVWRSPLCRRVEAMPRKR